MTDAYIFLYKILLGFLVIVDFVLQSLIFLFSFHAIESPSLSKDVKGNDVDVGSVDFLLHVGNFCGFLVDPVRSGSLDASSLGAGKTLVAISSSALFELWGNLENLQLALLHLLKVEPNMGSIESLNRFVEVPGKHALSFFYIFYTWALVHSCSSFGIEPNSIASRFSLQLRFLPVPCVSAFRWRVFSVGAFQLFDGELAAANRAAHSRHCDVLNFIDFEYIFPTRWCLWCHGFMVCWVRDLKESECRCSTRMVSCAMSDSKWIETIRDLNHSHWV